MGSRVGSVWGLSSLKRRTLPGMATRFANPRTPRATIVEKNGANVLITSEGRALIPSPDPVGDVTLLELCNTVVQEKTYFPPETIRDDAPVVGGVSRSVKSL